MIVLVMPPLMEREMHSLARMVTMEVLEVLVTSGEAEVFAEAHTARITAMVIRSFILKAVIWEISLKTFLAEALKNLVSEAALVKMETLIMAFTAISGKNGGFGNRQSYQTKGNDIHADIQVNFDAAAFGKKETIHLKDENGKVQALEVNIPAGIETGQSIRLKGKGTPGYNGGTAGDLFLKVTVSEKPGFKRDGQDIFNTVTIPFITAVLGGDVTVPTIYGNVRCSIKPGTQSGSKLRLRGKGIVSMKNSSVHGDQYTTIEVQVPKNLSPKAKQKLREFAAEL